jgi:hypothetical protein
MAVRFEQITEADLNALVAQQVPESIVLDYKRDLVGGSDKDRYEFLGDVSSFANTTGGEILFGIEEANGLPTKLVGINTTNIGESDKLVLAALKGARSAGTARFPISPIRICEAVHASDDFKEDAIRRAAVMRELGGNDLVRFPTDICKLELSRAFTNESAVCALRRRIPL